MDLVRKSKANEQQSSIMLQEKLLLKPALITFAAENQQYDKGNLLFENKCYLNCWVGWPLGFILMWITEVHCYFVDT